MMFNALNNALRNAAIQSDFKSFLQEYHKHVSAKHGLKPLKLGKALHACAEVLGQPSWHHLAAQTDNAPQSALDDPYRAMVFSKPRGETASSISKPFDTEFCAYRWIWTRYVIGFLEKTSTLEGSLSDCGYSEIPVPLSLDFVRTMVHHYYENLIPNRENPVGQFVVFETDNPKQRAQGGNLSAPRASTKAKTDEVAEKGQGSASRFEIALAHQAGYILVEAESREQVEAAVANVSQMIEGIEMVCYRKDDRSLCYHLDDPIYRSDLDEIVRKLMQERQLWWIAEDPKEAEQWVNELTAKGARMISVRAAVPTNPTGQVDVVFGVNPLHGQRFFPGGVIQPRNYLDEDLAKI